jgi:two-component system, cell cycle sensor histidine kinase and response regulator CckA
MGPTKNNLGRVAEPNESAAERGHVLIVDQETSAREFMDQLLRSAGYITVRAMNGQEALEIAEQFGPFDLLLTDEQTPRMAGQELVKRLREREPWLKVIYLTGHTERLFEAKGRLWDDEAILEKRPSSVPGLLETVSTLLAKRMPTKRS